MFSHRKCSLQKVLFSSGTSSLFIDSIDVFCDRPPRQIFILSQQFLCEHTRRPLSSFPRARLFVQAAELRARNCQRNRPSQCRPLNSLHMFAYASRSGALKTLVCLMQTARVPCWCACRLSGLWRNTFLHMITTVTVRSRQ